MVTALDYNHMEHERLELQARLDAAKTQAERNKMGQFATPSKLAEQIMAHARTLVPNGQKVRFLDPAIGTGSFYSALLRVFPNEQLESAVGYEIDSHYACDASKLWANTPLRLEVGDFTLATPPATGKANLIICNPPYVRHHHLTKDEKRRLQQAVRRVAGVSLSGLAGLYCYFLCLSHAWMDENGIAGWLIPSEFMDTNYGSEVKKYLLNKVTLMQIHRFDPNDVQFGDADVSSAIVWFKKAVPPPCHCVAFTYGGEMTNPTLTKHIPLDVLHHEAKWTGLPMAPSRSRRSGIRISDLFTVKRGLATGSNDFFVLTAEEVRNHAIPQQFLRPILPSPRYLPVDVIEADSLGNPLIERPLFLLSCNAPESELYTTYPALWEYLQVGIHAGVNKRYLCRHRTPWYSQEDRPPAPFLCTYMGRTDSGSGPFRFILNRSNATAANSYLMLYPKPKLRTLLGDDPSAYEKVWQGLNAISIDALVGGGRVYGGGLHKVEPKELANVPADTLLTVVGSQDDILQQALPI